TGPFALERWDRQARKVFLKRNGDYWRAPAKLERVLVMSANEFGTSRLMLQAGDADIIDVSRSLLQQVEGIPGVRVVDNLPRLQTDPVLFFTLRINPEANPDIGSGKLDGDGVPPDFFQDASLRKAFAYAFDDRAFIEQAFRGRAVRAKGPIPPGIPGYDAGQAAYGHDLKKAALFFKKAHGGRVWERGFRFTLTYNVGSELREVACQILKRNVESLNPKFRIDLRGVEWASFLDKTQARKMPMWSRGWVADYPDAHNFAFPFFHSQGRYAIAQGYNNPEMDRLIEKAVVEVRPGPRAALYRRIQTLGFEEAVQIYTIHPAGSSVQRTWVRGFTDNPIFMGIYFYPIYKEL
ncbi:MAG: ABC transporter substrate-binding protein, partial [Elusimicrobia bacterium]|nr:ABC transporter substrate-binding protein [Elusimicrobiota bacterium]